MYPEPDTTWRPSRPTLMGRPRGSCHATGVIAPSGRDRLTTTRQVITYDHLRQPQAPDRPQANELDGPPHVGQIGPYMLMQTYTNTLENNDSSYSIGQDRVEFQLPIL